MTSKQGRKFQNRRLLYCREWAPMSSYGRGLVKVIGFDPCWRTHSSGRLWPKKLHSNFECSKNSLDLPWQTTKLSLAKLHFFHIFLDRFQTTQTVTLACVTFFKVWRDARAKLWSAVWIFNNWLPDLSIVLLWFQSFRTGFTGFLCQRPVLSCPYATPNELLNQL